MKKTIVFLCAAFALLCVSFNASAQFAAPIMRHGTDLVDQNGHKLTDNEIIDLVGADIYGETVVGARKQMRAGTGLIIGGGVTLAAGLAGCFYAGYEFGQSGMTDVKEYMKQNETVAGIYFASYAVSAVGALALGGGLAFHFVGKSRLNWAEEQCNDAISHVILDFGPTANGAGLVLRF